MDYPGPPPTGVTLADRTVRHLGIEVANTQIALANQNAKLEELAEFAAHVNFELWEAVDQSLPPVEGAPPPPPPQQYLVPSYQVDAVARLLSLLQRL